TVEPDTSDGKPELAAVDLHRLGLRPGLAALRELRDRLPRREDLRRPAADRLGGREAGDVCRRRVPEPNDAALIDEENAVRDVLDDDGCTRPLFGSSVQKSVVNRDSGTASELLRELKIVFAVAESGCGHRVSMTARN